METLVSAIGLTTAFIFGACIGSFLNVVVYRIPAGISLIYPPSRCPRCLHGLGMTENVPIFGWLWLRGRCRWCKTKISSRYPIVEATTGTLFALVFWRFGYSIETIGYCAFLSWLLSLSLIDLDTMTLPSVLTKSGLVLGLVFQGVVGWQMAQGQGIAARLMFGVGGAVLGIWLLEIIALIGSMMLGQQAMGDADGKLMATIGAWVGWKYVLLSGFIACGVGSIIGGGAIALGIIGKKQPMPFGPFLALGGALSLFVGETIIKAYTNTFFNF
ncbi:prepilin peptidase [Pleurocapsales cyanobacterium LEGE 10410]|nr:prepilin peptidase [Pleurocapsales cyanobacterium LEGE 10410]